jgi:hypothetical protein
MPSNLERNLVSGGVAPAAAKLIANAIDNVATGRVNIGEQLADATPTRAMRMIDADTRRYVLTNLDYPKDNPLRQRASDQASQPAYPDKDHPYRDSQPASANPTISTPGVKAGQFVSVSTATANNVAQSEVTLRVATKGGTHARLNQATGEVESVPFLIEVEPKTKLEASVEERPDATVIKLRFLT